MGVTPRGCTHEGAFDVGAVEGGAGPAGKRRGRVRAFKGLAGAGADLEGVAAAAENGSGRGARAVRGAGATWGL